LPSILPPSLGLSIAPAAVRSLLGIHKPKVATQRELRANIDLLSPADERAYEATKALL